MNKNTMSALSKKIKISTIDTKIIRRNVKWICENIHQPLKRILQNMNIPPTIPVTDKREFAKIFNYVKNSHLTEFTAFNRTLNDVKQFCKMETPPSVGLFHSQQISTSMQLSLYFPCERSNPTEGGDANCSSVTSLSLFKIASSLATFCNIQKQIIIIWIPTNINRDFAFDTITNNTLRQSYNSFGAFTTSGVTFHDKNTVISIITRCEEIEKLLIHELCHAFNLDGSHGFDNHKNIIKKYETLKPPNNYKYDYCIYETYAELLASYFYLTYKDILNFPKLGCIDRREDVMDLTDTEFQTIMYQQILVEILYSFNIIANLIALNEKTYETFIREPSFAGDMCFYEYYYLKALMYCDYELEMYHGGRGDFANLYKNIMNVMRIREIPLLKNVCENMVKTNNFRYMWG
jgi:hypothetical protein